MSIGESNCTCSVPCHRVSYEPALSYAQLSKFTLNRLVLQDPVRRTAIRKQYKRAKENFQRMDPITSAYDTAILQGQIKEKTRDLSVTLARATQNLSTKTLETSIWKLYDALSIDSGYLEYDVRQEIENTIDDIDKAFWRFRNSFPVLWSFVQGLKDKMEDHETLSTYVPDCTYAVAEQDDQNSYNQVWNPADIPPEKQAESVKQHCIKLPHTLDSVLKMAEVYTSGITVLFSSEPTHVDDHNECLRQLARTEDRDFINKTEKLSALLMELFQAPDAPEAQLMDLAERIVELATDPQLVHMDDLYIAAGYWCTWVWEEGPDNIKSLADGLASAANRCHSLASTYTYYSDIIFRMNQLLTSDLNATLSAVDDYLTGARTKLEMSEVFGDFVSATAISDLQSVTMTLGALSVKLAEGFYHIDLALKVFALHLFSMEVSVLNTERLSKMKILSFALTLGNESINALHANVTEDPETYFPLITSGILSQMKKSILLMGDAVYSASRDAADALSSYSAKMETYRKEMTMDEKFLMCVCVFFVCVSSLSWL